MKIGDRVGYSAKFLRSTGQIATNDRCVHEVGEVTDIRPFGKNRLIEVTWPKTKHHDVEVRTILEANLAFPGSSSWSA